MERQEIEKKVVETFKRANYTDMDNPINVIKLAKNLGFSIVNAILNNDDDGFLLVKKSAKELMGIHNNKIIGVNAKQTYEWKRFIIAHEIGHYILEGQNEEIYANRFHAGHNEQENEMDYFAAALLMPENVFSEKYNELINKGVGESDIIAVLMKRFKVTEKMASRRIMELGLNG